MIHVEALREMSRVHSVAVSGLASLLLWVALSACGANESPPAFPDSRSLKSGPLTPEARKRAAELGSDDGRTVSEAQHALKRFGRDAVPALVEVLEGRASPRAKHIAAGILGDMGVAADASIPVLQGLKVKGPSELSALVAPAPDHPRSERLRSGRVEGRLDAAGAHRGGPRLRSSHASPDRHPANHRVLSTEQTRGCEPFYAHSAQNAAQEERKIVALTGRGIGRFYGSYSAAAVQVGDDVPPGPGGVSYSPELTVDDYPVLRSEIPAGEKGIDALQRLGKIRLATARDLAAWSGDFIIPVGVPRPKGPKAHCSFYYLKDHTFE
jgi:hypothetical protein